MDKLFRRFGILTITSVIVLIFVGGIVRATGSGMGCPDWPKCFGSWIPPTNIDQLPQNYQEIFGEKLKGEVVFNPIKTWIEYLNRLLGVLIGFFVFLTFLFSFIVYRKSEIKIVIFSFISFLLVGFEGWLGSKVVSSELHPVLITIHMLVSLLLLGLLILIILKSFKVNMKYDTFPRNSAISFLLIISFFLVISQIVFGTQIREGIDLAQKSMGDDLRAEWVNSVYGKVLFHGGLSLLILGLHFKIFLKVKQMSDSVILFKWAKLLFTFVIFSILSGSILGFAGFPAIVQPFHLVFSSIIVSLQFVVYFLLEPELI